MGVCDWPTDLPFLISGSIQQNDCWGKWQTRIQWETVSRLHHSFRCYRAVLHVNIVLMTSLAHEILSLPPCLCMCTHVRACAHMRVHVFVSCSYDSRYLKLHVRRIYYCPLHCQDFKGIKMRKGRLNVKTTSFPWSSYSLYKWKTRSFFICHSLNHVNSFTFFLTEISKHFNWSSPSQLHLSRCVWPARM